MLEIRFQASRYAIKASKNGLEALSRTRRTRQQCGDGAEKLPQEPPQGFMCLSFDRTFVAFNACTPWWSQTKVAVYHFGGRNVVAPSSAHTGGGFATGF